MDNTSVELLKASVSPMAIPNAFANLARIKRNGEMKASLNGWSELDPVTKNVLVVGGVLIVGLLIVRAAASYYIGAQFGRPKASAAMGGLFGAPGLGVVALFGKGRKS